MKIIEEPGILPEVAVGYIPEAAKDKLHRFRAQDTLHILVEEQGCFEKEEEGHKAIERAHHKEWAALAFAPKVGSYRYHALESSAYWSYDGHFCYDDAHTRY